MVAIAADDPASVSETGGARQAVHDLRNARELVNADPSARAFLASTATDPEINSPLASWLYGHWWVGHHQRVEAFGIGRSQVAALEVGRRQAAEIERGFVVLAADDNRVVAAVARLGAGVRIVQRGADAVVGSSRPGLPARPGDLVDLVAGLSLVDPDGIWWWVHCSDEAAEEPMDRWYLNVSAHSAPAAARATVTLAQRSGVPLSFKCPVDPAGYARSDAMVVYGPRALVPDLAAHLETWLSELEPLVGPDSPPLTRPLLPGVSTAEDPGGAISYGQLRCAQVAAALADLQAMSTPGAEVAALARVGIDAERFETIPAVRR